jgi:hypothetical protein
MKRAAVLAALAASACNAPGGNGGQPAAAVSMRPGQWETTTRMVSVSAPTAPPEVQARLQASLSEPPAVERSCLTAAETANFALTLRDRLLREQNGFTCETGETLFAGGRIRMTLTCRSTTGAPDMRQAMAGTYTADTLQAAVSAESATPATDQAPSIPVRVDTTLVGRRIGDCPTGATN